ncbi:MAG: VacJ family lipoprotein [Comamonas sp.]
MNSSNLAGASRIPLSLALVLTLALAGCATTAADPQAGDTPATARQANPADPFEPFNRNIYSFNTALDDAVIKPVATLYRDVTPALAREGVGNFFSNLGDAWSFLNNLAQGRGEGAYNSAVRFSVNTVLGIGGLLDIAGEMGVERRPQDFGLTLGRWGVPTGPYLVLPVLGSSTVRDTAALPVDVKGNLLGYSHDMGARNSLTVLGLVDKRARLLQAGEMLDAVALDKYSLTRDVYLQRRDLRVQGDGGENDDFADVDADAGMLPPEQ